MLRSMERGSVSACRSALFTGVLIENGAYNTKRTAPRPRPSTTVYPSSGSCSGGAVYYGTGAIVAIFLHGDKLRFDLSDVLRHFFRAVPHLVHAFIHRQLSGICTIFVEKIGGERIATDRLLGVATSQCLDTAKDNHHKSLEFILLSIILSQ